MNDYDKALFEESEKLLKALGELRDALKDLHKSQTELAKNMGQMVISLSDQTQDHGNTTF